VIASEPLGFQLTGPGVNRRTHVVWTLPGRGFVPTSTHRTIRLRRGIYTYRAIGPYARGLDLGEGRAPGERRCADCGVSATVRGSPASWSQQGLTEHALTALRPSLGSGFVTAVAPAVSPMTSRAHQGRCHSRSAPLARPAPWRALPLLDPENIGEAVPLLLVERIVKHLPQSRLRLPFGFVLLMKHGSVNRLDESPTHATYHLTASSATPDP